jgi:putative FmdB family regulatory protein
MAMVEFECKCGLRFEKLIRSKNLPELYQCPACSSDAPRKISNFGFVFGDGKVDGNTGVYSLDKDGDKRIGRDAQSAWETYKDRFTRKRQVQREAGGEGKVPLKLVDGDYVPMSNDEVDKFRKTHLSYSKVLKEHRRERQAKGIGQHD